MPPLYLGQLIAAVYLMEKGTFISIDYSAARGMHILVEQRISYEILLLSYKALNDHGKQNIVSSLLKYRDPSFQRIDITSISQNWRLVLSTNKLPPRQSRPAEIPNLPLSVKQGLSVDSAKVRPVKQTILIVYLHSSVKHFVEKWMQVI